MRKRILSLLVLLAMVAQGAWADGTIDCTPSDKNKVLCTDGSIYDNVSAAGAASKTPVAKIIVVDTENHKGLALALSDEGQMNYSNAVTACNNKKTSTPVTNATWAIPSKDEWEQMITAAGSYTALRDGFSGIGGTNISNASMEKYWTSTTNTDYSNQVNWTYDFSDNYHGWKSTDRGGVEVHVRLCLRFDIPIPTHNAALADGTPTGWSITPTTPEEGSTVTVSYSGQHRVKSVRVRGIAKLTCEDTDDVSFAQSEDVNSTKTKVNVSAFGGTVSVSSSDESKCTVSYADGTITITRKNANAFSGTQITVSVTPNDNFVWRGTNVTFNVSGVACDPGVPLANSSAGYMVSTNGKAYPVSYKDSWNSKWGTVAGVVVKKTDSTHGYVVSLYNVGGSASSDGQSYTYNDFDYDALLPTVTAVSGRTWQLYHTKDAYTAALTSQWNTAMGYITAAGGRSLGSTLRYWSSTGNSNINHSVLGEGIKRKCAL